MKRKTKNTKTIKVPPRVPPRVSPEKRMDRYPQSGNITDTENIRFPQFKIVVPSEWDKEQLQAALEYLHDNRLIDTDFIPVNCLVHAYLEPPDSLESFVTDVDLYLRLQQQTCTHTDTFDSDGITYCRNCFKALKLPNFNNR